MRYGRTSITLMALTLPLTLLLGNLVSWYYKARNPDGVDITAGLAYLRPILVTSLLTFLALAVATVLTGVLGLRRDADPQLARLALVLVAAITALSVLAGVASSRSGAAEDQYRNRNAALGSP